MKRIYIKPDIETTQISIEKHLAAGSPSNPGYDYGENGSGGSGTVNPPNVQFQIKKMTKAVLCLKRTMSGLHGKIDKELINNI